MDKILGKLAYKKTGFFSGLYGVVKLNEEGFSKYCLEFRNGSMVGFNNKEEVVLEEEGN